MAGKKEYIKLWLSYMDYFGELSDGEVGRLVRAMIQYRVSREEPKFNGNERFIWPAIRREIDQELDAQLSAGKAHRECGKKGGRPGAAAKSNGDPQSQENQIGFSENQENQFGFSKTNLVQGKGEGVGEGKGEGKGQREKERKEKAPSGPQRKVFSPPCVQQVQEYCLERQNGVDAEVFVDFYTARGWKYGSGRPMVDWKAAVRTWERRAKERQPADRQPRWDDPDYYAFDGGESL